MNAHEFVHTLAVVLGTAALTTVLSRWMGVSVVLGYLVAGLIVGPHVPIPLVADVGIVETLAETGVILLMLSIGLELSVRKVLSLAPVVGSIAAVEMGVMALLGYLAARVLGWSNVDAVFAAGMVAISSTMVIAKTFAALGLKGRFVDVVFGVLIFEDLAAIVFVTVLGAIAAGMSPSAESLLGTVSGLVGFLIGAIVIGLPVVPRLFRIIGRFGSAETTTVAAVGFCFTMSALASAAGYSVALGAFLAGVLISESGEGHAIERLVEPIRDIFSAIFFVSVGMMIEPAMVLSQWPAILVFSAVVIAGKTFGVTLGAVLAGKPMASAARAGLALAQIGEFSFVIVGVGVTSGVVRPELLSVAVVVSAITAFTTPAFVGASEAFGRAVEERLPRSLRTFLALYHAWLVRVRGRPVRSDIRVARRRLRMALLDAGGIILLAVGAHVLVEPIVEAARSFVQVPAWAIRASIALTAIVLAVPFAIGIVRNTRGLATYWLGDLAAPDASDRLGPLHRALRDGVALGVLIVVAVPTLAIVLPLLPLGTGAVLGVVGVLVGASFIGAFRRTLRTIRAGSDVVLESLRSQLQPGPKAARPDTATLEPVAVLTIADGSAAVGRRVSQLGIEEVEGATVMAAFREQDGRTVALGDQPLGTGDRLLCAGNALAVQEVQKRLELGSPLDDSVSPKPAAAQPARSATPTSFH